ncbi:MAG: DUF4280 domain-containing protein [Paludibacteraceae bacterium]|nr:DUF4280 domain-containing protein [Paludibacteraceae bacterium]
MGKFVTNGALLRCTMGAAPVPLTVVGMRPMCQNMPMANIMDFAPMVNIKPFGVCRSMANPTVASATAAAMGVLTPMPCIPVITGPWSPGGQEKICNFPALLDNCKCMCAYGGNISITFPGNAAMATGK